MNDVKKFTFGKVQINVKRKSVLFNIFLFLYVLYVSSKIRKLYVSFKDLESSQIYFC